MATITIRNVDEAAKRRLQVRAALNGRSMEAELREMVSGLPELSSESAKTVEVPEENLGTAIHNLFAPMGGIDFQIPQHRKSHRRVPTFE